MYEPRKRYSITLKQAKELARTITGHLPRPGYMVDVYMYTQQETIIWDWSQRKTTEEVTHIIYLENCAGQYRLGETTRCKFG